MKRKKIAAILTSTILSSCATTYAPPKSPDQSYSAPHNSTKKAIISKAEQELLIQGFQIQATNLQSGYISTNRKNWRLRPEHADCGTTLGIDYLKDNRTKTEVSFNLIVTDTTLTIKSTISGEYKPGASDQDITLECNSRGVIEQELAEKII